MHLTAICSRSNQIQAIEGGSECLLVMVVAIMEAESTL